MFTVQSMTQLTQHDPHHFFKGNFKSFDCKVPCWKLLKNLKTVDKIFDYVLTLLHVIIKSENKVASGNALRGKKNGKNGFFPYPQRWNKNKSFGIKRMCQVKCLTGIESLSVFIEGLMSGI